MDLRHAAMQAFLEGQHGNGIDNEGTVGRALEPAAHLLRDSGRWRHQPCPFASAARRTRWPLTSAPACGDRLRKPGSDKAPTSATAANAKRKSRAVSASSPAPRDSSEACKAMLPNATPSPIPTCQVILESVLAAVRCAGETSTKGSVKRPVSPSERKPPVKISSVVVSHAGVDGLTKPHSRMHALDSSASAIRVPRKPNCRRIGVVSGFMPILPMALPTDTTPAAHDG